MKSVVYMEVDLKNKELPTGKIFDTAADLARACGLKPITVRCAISHCKKEGRPCRFVRVEIEED